MSPNALEQCTEFPVPAEDPKKAPQNQPSWLFNAMYAPFQKMAVRATLWYQVLILAPGPCSVLDAPFIFLVDAALHVGRRLSQFWMIDFYGRGVECVLCHAFRSLFIVCVNMLFWTRCGVQGEANADQKTLGLQNEDFHTAAYACKLQAMVADWRLRKGMGDFAFLNVQLPPSIDPADSTKDPVTGRPAIRAAAAEAVSRPGGLTDIAGMAVTVDLGGKSAWGFDHPVNKVSMPALMMIGSFVFFTGTLLHHGYDGC
jgi:hypothetical protein